MSIFEWAAVLIGIGVILIVWQLTKIAARLSQMVVMLQSLDAEAFHLAQEQNPSYGICSNCGRRAIVSHVVPTDPDSMVAESEMFYCRNCWWLSNSVRVSDENKHYKDRLSDRDTWAATVGPG